MPLIPPLGPPTQIPISNDAPGRIQIAKYVRNGLIPHASFTSQIARSVNYTAALRVKELFSWACPIVDIPASDNAARRDRWRFCAHTSKLQGAINVVFYMARSDGELNSSPQATLYLTNEDESISYGSATIHLGLATSTPDDFPSEFGYGTISISGVPANTTIYGAFADDEDGRLIAACVYEEALAVTAANGYVIPSAVAAGSPILGGRQQDLYELASELWAEQGAHLFNWTADEQDAPRTTTSTTAVGLLEGGAVPDDATMGWMLDTRYCGTRQRPSAIPCVFAARASVDAGTGRVKLKDASGATLATLTATTSAATWYTTTVDLADVEAKYYVTYEADATRTTSVYAVSCYQKA